MRQLTAKTISFFVAVLMVCGMLVGACTPIAGQHDSSSGAAASSAASAEQQEHLTGLVPAKDSGDANLYYVEEGSFVRKTGVAQRADGADGRWYFVQDGVCHLDDAQKLMVFDAVNPTAAAFLAAGPYDASDYGYSHMERLLGDVDAGMLDEPDAYLFTATVSAVVFACDEQTGQTIVIPDGPAGACVANLVPGKPYVCWMIDEEGTVLWQGRLQARGALRMIQGDAVRNVRDLGGWACDGGSVAYGLLFRGTEVDRWHVATPGDIERLRNAGVACELDLRSDEECGLAAGEAGTSELGVDIERVRFPVSDTYLTLADYPEAREAYAAALETVMENVIAGKPTYFHCAIGADRTGRLACLIEGILGMTVSDIDRDYELTSFAGTERLRTRDDWKYDIAYLEEQGHNSFRDNCVQWALDQGVSLETINRFRAAAIDGKPEVLEASDFGA